jgi:hypothetical protein
MLIVVDTVCLSRSPAPIVRACALGNSIAYTNTLLSISRPQLLLTLTRRGFPVGPLLDCIEAGACVIPITSSEKEWEMVGVQKKCVFVDAGLDVALPLLAFPHITFFVYLNWATRPVDVADVRDAMASVGLRVQQVSARMLRFGGGGCVADYYLDVRNLEEVDSAMGDFDAIFLSDRLPGETMMRHGRARIAVGGTPETPVGDDTWLGGREVTTRLQVDKRGVTRVAESGDDGGFTCI